MAKKKSIFKRYRLLPLVGVGFIIFCIISLAGILIWSMVTFQQQLDTPDQNTLPALLYLGAVFLACFAMTALIKGGTVFPSLALALLVCTLTLLLKDLTEVTTLSIIGKYSLTVFTAVIGFTISKLLFAKPRKQLH